MIFWVQIALLVLALACILVDLVADDGDLFIIGIGLLLVTAFIHQMAGGS